MIVRKDALTKKKYVAKKAGRSPKEKTPGGTLADQRRSGDEKRTNPR